MLLDNPFALYLELCDFDASTFSERYFRCGDVSRKAVPTMTRDVQTRLSSRDTLPGYFSCLLRETLLHSLGSGLSFAPALKAESRDGTINASTNDNGIHRLQ